MTAFETTTTPSWHLMRSTVFDNSLRMPDHASDEAQAAERNSNAMTLRMAFADAAISRAKEGGFAPESREAWDEIEAANLIADDLIYAVTGTLPFNMDLKADMSASDTRKMFNVVSHQPPENLFNAAMAGERLAIHLDDFERGVGAYLASDYRIPVVDRMIITALFDAEITHYLHSLLATDPVSRTNKLTEANSGRHPLREWLRRQGKLLGLYALVIVAAIALRMTNLISIDYAFLAITGTIGAAILWFAATLIMAILSIPRWRRQVPTLVDIPQKMQLLYRELHAPGPVGVRRIREMAQELDDMGAVWPSSVWAMIEDFEKRDVRRISD